MAAYPTNLVEFQKRFPDNGSCAKYLFELRWPDGFRCPKCAHDEAWKLTGRVSDETPLYECKKCHRQTSIKAGTIMHRSKQPLTIWFWAAWLMATHSNGMSALQLQKQLGIKRYETAWLLEAKLRKAMVDNDRKLLNGIVEIDESSLPFRQKDEPKTGGQGRSHQGKMLIVGACEARKAPEEYKDREWVTGRARLSVIDSYGSKDLHPFIEQNIAPESTGKTDGHAPYESAPNITHEKHVIGDKLAHEELPLVHLLFSNLQTWAKGTYHGLRKKHLQSYLDEYVFRANRRHNRPSGFKTLLRLAMTLGPTTYDFLTAPEPTG